MQAFDFLEIFAGSSILTRVMRAHGRKSAALDVVYDHSYRKRRARKKKRNCKSNFFDLLSPAGFAAAVLACLGGKLGSHFVWFGVVCSSWVSISRATTGRTYVNPGGFPWVRCVQDGNTFAARPGNKPIVQNSAKHFSCQAGSPDLLDGQIQVFTVRSLPKSGRVGSDSRIRAFRSRQWPKGQLWSL